MTASLKRVLGIRSGTLARVEKPGAGSSSAQKKAPSRAKRWRRAERIQEMAYQVLDDDAMVDEFVHQLGKFADAWSTLSRKSLKDQEKTGKSDDQFIQAAAWFFEALWRSLEIGFEPHLANWSELQEIFSDYSHYKDQLRIFGEQALAIVELFANKCLPNKDDLTEKRNELIGVPGHAFWNIALLLLCKRIQTAQNENATKLKVSLKAWRSASSDNTGANTHRKGFEGFVVVGADDAIFSAKDEDRIRILGFGVEVLDEVDSGVTNDWPPITLSRDSHYQLTIEVLSPLGLIKNEADQLEPAPFALDSCSAMRKRDEARSDNSEDSSDSKSNRKGGECWYQWRGELKAFRLEFRPDSDEVDQDVGDKGVLIFCEYLIHREGDHFREDDEKKFAISGRSALGIRVRHRDALGIHWSEPLRLPIQS